MIAPGANIAEGQPVMELETDKAVVEVPSSVSGTVKDIRVKEGEKVKVGQVIFTVENGTGARAKAPEEKVAESRRPKLSDNIEAANLVRLMISPDTKVSEDQPIMELETDKAVVEVPSSV